VEIVVATTFAVSWKPFVKSKANAVPTTTIKRMSELVEFTGREVGGSLNETSFRGRSYETPVNAM
jgi:hypothetical protein